MSYFFKFIMKTFFKDVEMAHTKFFPSPLIKYQLGLVEEYAKTI